MKTDFGCEPCCGSRDVAMVTDGLSQVFLPGLQGGLALLELHPFPSLPANTEAGTR